MIFKVFILFSSLLITVRSATIKSDEDYIDAVIDMLLNGESGEFTQSDEDESGEMPVLTAGIWMCGNCTDLDASKLAYSEVNEVDSDISEDDSVDVQVGLTLQDMRCVTVSSDTPGVVRRVSGSCSGGTVTLNVAPAHHFTVRVYN